MHRKCHSLNPLNPNSISPTVFPLTTPKISWPWQRLVIPIAWLCQKWTNPSQRTKKVKLNVPARWVLQFGEWVCVRHTDYHAAQEHPNNFDAMKWFWWKIKKHFNHVESFLTSQKLLLLPSKRENAEWKFRVCADVKADVDGCDVVPNSRVW